MKRVALINMPWVAIDRPSIALGTLKRVLRREGIPTDVFYLNIRLARMLSAEVYSAVASSHVFGEWLFAQHLFGEYGSGELTCTYADAARDCFSFCDTNGHTIDDLSESANIDFEQICREVVPRFIEECLTAIPWQRYEVVGFTSIFSQQLASLLLAKKIKERLPATKIVFGGANVHGVMGHAAIEAFDWIDYVVDQEGEPVLPALVKNVFGGKPFERLPGLSMRLGERVFIEKSLPSTYRLDDAPIPDYTDYFRQLRSSGFTNLRGTLLFESSRGCWWGEKAHCTFCGLNGQLMKYRAKSPERVLQEVVTQSRRYNSFGLEAVDNIMDTDSFSTFLPELGARNLDLEIFYEVKSSLTKDQVRTMRRAGVLGVQPGIESLNTEILKLMRKGVTAIQNIQLLKFCRELGVRVTWSLLYGFPGENRDHYEQLLKAIPFITHLYPPLATPRIVLQRFSPYHFDSERLGIRNVRPAKIYEYIYPQQRVNLNNIAYYFEYSLDEAQENPESYINPIKTAIRDWKVAFHLNHAALTYRRGHDFIELCDTRDLGRQDNARAAGKTILTGVESEVYLYCDSIRSFSDICRYVARRTAGKLSAESVRAMLRAFVERKLMFVEQERFLSLATAAVRTRRRHHLD